MRLYQLDGCRGVAALIVVLHHSLLLTPGLAAPYYGHRPEGVLANVLYRSPLHVFWDGSDAVAIFFVLSGFVLARSMKTAKLARWARYYVQRLPRLYLPIFASVALAVAWALAFRRSPIAGQSLWLAEHDHPIRPQVVRSMLVLTRESYSLNMPLWWLTFEVAFSILLPLYLWGARLLSRVWPVMLLAAPLGVGLMMHYHVIAVVYFSEFLVGVVMAQHQQEVREVMRRVPQGMALLAALILFWLPWLPWPEAPQTIARPCQMLAAMVVVATLLVDGPVTRGLRRPWAQWLGTISFSLYLVHEPVVVSFGQLGLNSPGVAFKPLFVSLALASVFYRMIESPAHRLAQRLGRLVPVTN